MNRFNGNRIKNARLYNGLTVEELANELGVSKQAVSQYENNQVDPPIEKGFILSKILGFPLDYFSQEDKSNVKVGTTYFRALLRTNSKSRTQQEARLEHIGIIYSFLNTYVNFPELDLPKFKECITPKEAALKLRVGFCFMIPFVNSYRLEFFSAIEYLLLMLVKKLYSLFARRFHSL